MDTLKSDAHVTPPPAYSEMPAPIQSMTTEPSVICRVCQQLINIRGREDQRVVKCANCQEGTPIKPPPAGRKYVRCPCNALLTCKVSSVRISCSRPNCKLIINLAVPPTMTVPALQRAQFRVTCGHCNEIYVLPTARHLARCPHCQNVAKPNLIPIPDNVTLPETLSRYSREAEQELHPLQEVSTEKEERETKLIRQLRQAEEEKKSTQSELARTEQGLRNYQEQLQEKELREAMLHEQLKVREEQKQNLKRLLSEVEQQLQERDLTEASLRSQLREKEQEQENSQRQLREMEQWLTNCEEQVREKEEERSHLEQQVTTLQRQLRAKDEELNELELSLSTAQLTIDEQRRQETRDWVIPRSEIQVTDKCLGKGGWGSVNEGTYCGCTIAVKQIHELILSPHNRRLFEREMNIASRCRHPCLLQFIGATNDEGSPLFVTELMETSLRALLEERGLSESEISVISLDVSRALYYLHQKTIVHRDVSSANVLLWRQGDQWRGKVSDYGTANFTQQTMTVAPGASIYSAPEALTADQTVKVDVYSVGVLLCEMSIRELPEPERREEQVARMKNRAFRGLVRRCLQTDPAQRPNMGEIIQSLKQLLPTSQ